jgi:isopropylmalate/homocitrate/citramalate synthase
MKCERFIAAVAVTLLLASSGYAQDGSKSKPKTATQSTVKNTPTLAETLDLQKAKVATMLPAEVMAKIADGIKAARDEGVEASAKNVGDAAPDATLTNYNGQSIQLSSLWEKGPVVLMWYRGGW